MMSRNYKLKKEAKNKHSIHILSALNSILKILSKCMKKKERKKKTQKLKKGPNLKYNQLKILLTQISLNQMPRKLKYA